MSATNLPTRRCWHPLPSWDWCFCLSATAPFADLSYYTALARNFPERNQWDGRYELWNLSEASSTHDSCCACQDRHSSPNAQSRHRIRSCTIFRYQIRLEHSGITPTWEPNTVTACEAPSLCMILRILKNTFMTLMMVRFSVDNIMRVTNNDFHREYRYYAFRLVCTDRS